MNGLTRKIIKAETMRKEICSWRRRGGGGGGGCDGGGLLSCVFGRCAVCNKFEEMLESTGAGQPTNINTG
jgi:hypothetical protein